MTSLVEIENVHVRHKTRAGVVRAVDGVSLAIEAGETLGLVGESGCGKSTLGRALLRLVHVDEGRVRFDGADVHALSSGAMRTLRRRMQIVFQDPYASLNPRMRVEDIVGEAIDIHHLAATRDERRDKVRALL